MSEIAESVSATSGGLPPTPAKRLLDQAIESQATTTDVAPVDGPPIPPLQADDQDDGPSFAKRMRLLSPTTTEERETSGLTSSNDLDCDGVGCSAGPSGIDLKGKGREETINQAAADKSVDLPKALKPDERLERLVDELESELSCPVCAAVLYKPVTIQPGCGHAFCGACLYGYLSASSPAPHVCPSCRTPSTSAGHSRIVATMVEVLLIHAPDRARTQNEMDQADDIWDIGMPLRFGAPPPPPERIRPSECYRPCRHCPSNNAYGWSCPIPVPAVGSDGPLYPLDGPTPPGHFQCASCTRLAASEAPSTTSCSVCEAHYCGAPGGHNYYGNATGDGGICSPQTFLNSKPGEGLWGRSALDLCDAIHEGQSDEMMNAFRDNIEEISIFARYIGTHPEHTPAALWEEMLEWLQSDEGMAKGGVKGIFRRTDEGIHYGFHGEMPLRTCKACTDDIFACGLYEWWERKRPTVLSQLEKEVQRPNCKNGRNCYRQGNGDHARKFNHVCAPAPPEIIDSIAQDDSAPVASSSSSVIAPAASSSSTLAVSNPLVGTDSSTTVGMPSAAASSASYRPSLVTEGTQALGNDGIAFFSNAGYVTTADAPTAAAEPTLAGVGAASVDSEASPFDFVDEPGKLYGLSGAEEPVLGDASPRGPVVAAV